MKILIAADMEGISGVVNWDQVTTSHPEYTRFRRIMTEDVNAAIEGAAGAGATEFIVADGHAHGYNILIEALDPRTRLSSGNSSPLAMLNGIERGGVDGVFFVGYHARAGTKNAILDHTWSSRCVQNLYLNELPLGEIGLNAAVCGHFGAPVLLVTGDQSATYEARDLLGPVEVAVVKHATSRTSAECLPLGLAREKICEAAARAVTRLKTGQAPPPFQLPAPIQVTVQLTSSDMADRASLLPGSSRIEEKQVTFTAPDMLTAYQSFRAAVKLAAE